MSARSVPRSHTYFPHEQLFGECVPAGESRQANQRARAGTAAMLRSCNRFSAAGQVRFRPLEGTSGSRGPFDSPNGFIGNDVEPDASEIVCFHATEAFSQGKHMETFRPPPSRVRAAFSRPAFATRAAHCGEFPGVRGHRGCALCFGCHRPSPFGPRIDGDRRSSNCHSVPDNSLPGE